jgi:hypothetical protein
MSSVLSRESLRERINLMEALEGVVGAIEDMGTALLGAGESVKVEIKDREGALITAAHAIPHEVLNAGLRAMQSQLQSMLEKQE